MRTCTTLIFTDGSRSRYAVMQGKMKGRYFDAHSANIIATYDRPSQVGGIFERATALETLYRELTAIHATKEAPAVRWQA